MVADILFCMMYLILWKLTVSKTQNDKKTA